VDQETEGFLKGFYRDLQQTQPCHIEIVGEKNTLLNIIKPVAAECCIPLTIGRGYSSLPPRKKLFDRFRLSGRQRLILLVLSDYDPEGEDIAHSFARSMRDDFGITNIQPIKVALTADQVTRMRLPPIMTAKKTSSRHKGFVAKHGETVHEIEAVPPQELQGILREAVNSVMDVQAFNREVEAEKQDAAFLEGVRKTIHSSVLQHLPKESD
jgi:hypothetical protein